MARSLHEEDPFGLLVEEKDEDDDGQKAGEEENGTAVAKATLNGDGGKNRKSQEGGDLTNAGETARVVNWDPVTGKVILPHHVKRMLSAMKVTQHDEVCGVHILFSNRQDLLT